MFSQIWEADEKCSKRSIEKLFWVVVVIASLAFPAVILRYSSANCHLTNSNAFWNRVIMLTLFSGALFPTGTMIQAFREAIQ